jgi:hypothetical protein
VLEVTALVSTGIGTSIEVPLGATLTTPVLAPKAWLADVEGLITRITPEVNGEPAPELAFPVGDETVTLPDADGSVGSENRCSGRLPHANNEKATNRRQ